MNCLRRRREKKEAAQKINCFTTSVNKDPYLKIRVRKGERTPVSLQQYIYVPGERLEGQVLLELGGAIEITALEVTLKGRHIFWYMSNDNMGRALHTKSKIFLTIHDLLWTEDNTTGKKLNKGRNIYPFEFFLPVAIPSTLKVGNNIKGARIKYEVKATFYTKSGAKVHSTIAEAFVSRVLPNDSAPEEFQKPVQEFRRQVYFCGVWSLKCNLHMPKRVFTEGETVPIDIHVENNTGLNITEIQCILYQTVRVKCTLTKHYRFVTPISRLLLPVLIENGQENTFDNILMPVPIPLEASSLHHQEKCLNRVRIAYYIKVILKTPTFAFKEITVSRVPLCISTLQKTETPRSHGCPAAFSHQGSIHEVFDKVVRDARELICIIKEH